MSLLATARVANVPSVLSNVWLGSVIGGVFVAESEEEYALGYVGGDFWWLAGAGASLYLAGNFLNDWYDRDWDARYRPERALPRGLFSPWVYFSMAVALMVLGALCAWVAGVVAFCVTLVICAFVMAYTVTHKRVAWGVVWIGLCRALLVVLGVLGMAHSEWEPNCKLDSLASALVLSVPLFCYIVGLSVCARYESRGEVPKWAAPVAISLLLLPLLLAGGYGIVHTKWIYVMIGLAPYTSWMILCRYLRRDISRYISALLAGIPLVDGMILLPLAISTMQQGLALSHLTWMVPLTAFVVSLLLQRIAPAS